MVNLRNLLNTSIQDRIKNSNECCAPQPDDGNNDPGSVELSSVRITSLSGLQLKLTPFPNTYLDPYIGSGQITQWPKNVAMDQKAAMRPHRFNSCGSGADLPLGPFSTLLSFRGMCSLCAVVRSLSLSKCGNCSVICMPHKGVAGSA